MRLARTGRDHVSVDVRFLLWNLNGIESASDLLKELGVGPE
jgi:hypothetical protein